MSPGAFIHDPLLHDCRGWHVLAGRCCSPVLPGTMLNKKRVAHNRSHGQLPRKLYRVWHQMRARCQYPSVKCYPNYGGRGIRVCEEWNNSYEPFRDWALANGYQEGLQIDRVDNDGDYEPSNCRWVTKSRNCRNRRKKSVQVAAFGETKSIMDWHEDERCVVKYKTLKARLQVYKWEPERAITQPTSTRS